MLSFLISAALLQGGMPVAYLTPEDMLYQDQVQYYGSDGTPLPINPRRAEQIVQTQDQQRLQSASVSSVSSSSSSVAGLNLHLGGELVPVDPAPIDAANSNIDPRTLRLLDRLQAKEQETQLADMLPQAPAQQTVYVTRPLASSGPEGIAAVLAMLFAMGATMLWARRGRGWSKSA